MNIKNLQPGVIGIIDAIIDSDIKLRLMELGLCPGTEIYKLDLSRGLYRVRGATLDLRSCELLVLIKS